MNFGNHKLCLQCFPLSSVYCSMRQFAFSHYTQSNTDEFSSCTTFILSNSCLVSQSSFPRTWSMIQSTEIPQVLMNDLSCASTNGYYNFLEQCWANQLDCSQSLDYFHSIQSAPLTSLLYY